MRSRRHARLVVVGLGRIGRLHARNLAGQVPSAQLAGVVDAVPAVAHAIGELHGVEWATSLRDVLSDPSVDGVVIAAPTHLHAELVESAAAAGKHVLCEKPLGFDLDASRRAVAAARTAGVELRVGFQRRFDPDWHAVKQALDAGELGELQLLRSSHRNQGPPEASSPLGDVFVDVAVHDLDAARWLGGEVVELSALAGPGVSGAPASATIALRFESGALGAIDVSRAAGYGFECSTELVGSRATARVGYLHRSADVELLVDGRASARVAQDHAERHASAYLCELDHFGDLVMGGDSHGATGDDAVAALELAQVARHSAAHGGAPPAERGPAPVADDAP
jgi:predicted dehydrogenase